MEIRTTRDIARQILRHRSFSFQEFSQRYAEVTATWVPREARLQDAKNRQNSIPTDKEGLKRWWMTVQDTVAETAKDAYEAALAAGIAKEQARAVLPEGLTESVLYMAGTVRSWIHYVQLRCAPGTQKEHQEIAQKCRDILLSEYPDLKGIM
jgi:thymidylate synthase (FAD)